MLGLWKWWPNTFPLWPLLLLALVVRGVAIFQFPHGDDIHRYVWEGKIQLKGYNPYEYAPNAKELKPFRDKNWKGINHKKISTIYWPAAQMIFKFCAYISPSVIHFKIIFTLFDIGVIILLLLLLKHLALSYNHLLLYTLNPFTIIYTAGEGHLEIAMVFCVFLGIYFWYKNHDALMFLTLGVAVMIKLTPIILLPYLIQRRNIRYIPIFLLPILLILPYMQNDVSLFTVPLHFFKEFRYNGLLYSIIRTLFDKQESLYLCSAVMIFCSGTVFFITPHPIRAISLITGIFLICTPTFHPWYMLLLTPFLVLYRSPPWIIFHCSILPLVFVFNRFAPRPFWRDKTLMLFIEYVPFVCVGIWYFFKGKRHWPVKHPSPKGISVIIPVYNENDTIAECIKSVQQQDHTAEIIAVDGGSSDNTRQAIRSFTAVKYLTSPQGRGIQIAHGIKTASGDIITILHADSRLKPGALSSCINTLQSNPDAVGGSFGAVYEDRDIRFRLTELLNNLRSRVTGISFGDQGQFFRRQAILTDFPSQKLMEDIEISFLLKEKGALLFLPDGVVSSTRRWKQNGYFKNFIKVITLSSYYIIRRKFGLLSTDCSDFYRLYYGKKQG